MIITIMIIRPHQRTEHPGRPTAGALARRTVVRLVVLCAALGVCWPAPAAGLSGAVVPADGTGKRGLQLRVIVNKHEGVGAVSPGIRTGHPVVKEYRLVNKGGADIHDIRVDDPGMKGARIVCPGGASGPSGSGRLRLLPGLASATCTAEGHAEKGARIAHATAVGTIPYLHSPVRATARSGYAGVGGTLTLRQLAEVTDPATSHSPARVDVRYALTNTGNLHVHGARITDRRLAPHGVNCAEGATTLRRIAPGQTVHCTAKLRLPPGSHVSEGLAEGSDRTRTLDRKGKLLDPPVLRARSTLRFGVAEAPVEPSTALNIPTPVPMAVGPDQGVPPEVGSDELPDRPQGQVPDRPEPGKPVGENPGDHPEPPLGFLPGEYPPGYDTPWNSEPGKPSGHHHPTHPSDHGHVPGEVPPLSLRPSHDPNSRDPYGSGTASEQTSPTGTSPKGAAELGWFGMSDQTLYIGAGLLGVAAIAGTALVRRSRRGDDEPPLI